MSKKKFQTTLCNHKLFKFLCLKYYFYEKVPSLTSLLGLQQYVFKSMYKFCMQKF